MDAAYDWSHLILRWFHVMGGISWVGSSLYFLYLGRVASSNEPAVVRGGGQTAATAGWFKRETALTWVSGLLLLLLVYVDFWSLPILVIAWFVYDRVWFARRSIAGVVSALLLIAAVWAMSRYYAGRLLYLELGALLGTLMAGNVWFRIVPGLAAEADERTLALARQRSAHNNYLIFPVVVLMLSNHVPGVYAADAGPAILVLLVLAFAAARHVVAGRRERLWTLGGVLALLGAMIALTVR